MKTVRPSRNEKTSVSCIATRGISETSGAKLLEDANIVIAKAKHTAVADHEILDVPLGAANAKPIDKA
ncbi:MAG: hypothetical protein ACRDNH_06170 [Gaiellaceae bacterium]